jgi:putative endonuclease
MNKKIVGSLGEKRVEEYLKKQGFDILERNFKTKFGELDIIAFKKNLVFIEVKTFLFKKENFKPEDEMHRKKLENFKKTSLFYANLYPDLVEKKGFRLDLAVVYLKENIIEYYENVIG